MPHLPRWMRRTALRCLAAGGVAFLAGCVSPQPPYQMQTRFNEAEFAKYAQKGTATMTGQAFSKTRGGDVKYAAGNTVTLVPITKFSEEFVQALIRGQRPPPEPRLLRHFKQTTADGNGNFEFKNLPAGEYYAECEIYWEVVGYRGSAAQTGGVLRKRVAVAEGETLKVILGP